MKNVLNSWRQRGLSFRGKALIINALALARIWYVAGLIHLSAWALRELSSLVFSFFWKGKPDLVAQKVVSQPTSLGGFGVVPIQLKVWALLVQWIRRLGCTFSTIIAGITSVVRLWMFFPALFLLICLPCPLSIALYSLPGRGWMEVFRSGPTPWLYALLVVSFNGMCRRCLPNSHILTFCPLLRKRHIA